jgi:hypothetical protein
MARSATYEPVLVMTGIAVSSGVLVIAGAVAWIVSTSLIAALYVISGLASSGGVLCVALDLRGLLARQRNYRNRLAELTPSTRDLSPGPEPEHGEVGALSDIEQLAQEVADMRVDLKELEERLARETEARERVLDELATIGAEPRLIVSSVR